MTRTKTRKKGKVSKGGRCYELSAQAVLFGDEKIAGWQDVRIVHGIPTGLGGGIEGRRYGHAWVEGVVTMLGFTLRLVYDAATGNTFPIALYYTAGKIDGRECRRYTRDEAIREMAAKNHYGPWAPLPEGVL